MFSGAGDYAFEHAITHPPGPITFQDDGPQRALVHLKLAAVQILPVQSVHSFLGLGHFGRRVWFYHELRAALPPDARTFWDANESLIREGVLAGGAYEQRLAQFRRRILPLVHAQPVIDALFACPSPEAQSALLTARWNTRPWALLCRVHPIARGIDAALRERWIREDCALQWQLTGGYLDLERGPAYLTTAGHRALRERVGRISLLPPGEKVAGTPAA